MYIINALIMIYICFAVLSPPPPFLSVNRQERRLIQNEKNGMYKPSFVSPERQIQKTPPGRCRNAATSDNGKAQERNFS